MYVALVKKAQRTLASTKKGQLPRVLDRKHGGLVCQLAFSGLAGVFPSSFRFLLGFPKLFHGFAVCLDGLTALPKLVQLSPKIILRYSFLHHGQRQYSCGYAASISLREVVFS